MKFSRLRINGFKSFVDAADVPIEAGLTGIVGPNGCGKSNLVEALRFVMGESSYKAMRGGGMDDVIFAGASNRPARNVAEVTLIAEGAAAPVARTSDPALEITRRIEREAGSTYRINGREARARDVQLLFADAATGARSSALVRQGQIAELIAAKPTQRRSILEDAAGISGLHARRGEAEQKLKAADLNLERLNDVLGEISGQLETLKRQARQAGRYRTLSIDIRKAEAVLGLIEWESVRSRLAESEARLAEIVTALAAAGQRQAEAAKDEAVAAAALKPLRDKAAEAGATLQRLRIALEALDREAAQRHARREELAARRHQASADLAHESEIEADAASARKHLDAEELRLTAESAASAASQDAASAAAVEANEHLVRAEGAFAEAAAAVAAREAEHAAHGRALAAARSRAKRLDDERRSIMAERDRLFAERDETSGLEEAITALAEAEADLASTEADAQAAEAALESARETERRATTPRAAAEKALASLQVEAKTLAEILDLGRGKDYPALMDRVDVAPGYEQALVAALGDDLDAALDARASAHWTVPPSSGADPALPAGVEPLSLHVSGPDELTRRLNQIGVVSEDTADALALELRPGQRLVTRSGGLWRWDGFRRRSDAAASAAKRLEQKNRLALLVQELKAARAKLDETTELLETAKQVRLDSEVYERECREALRNARRIVEAKRGIRAEAERRAGRLNERLSAIEGSVARLDADKAAADRECETAEAALARLIASADLARRKSDLQVAVAEARSRAADIRLSAEKLAHETAIRKRRLSELSVERERWISRVGRALVRRKELQERLSAIDAELSQAEAEPEAMELRRRSLLREIGAAELSAREAADALSSGEVDQRRLADRARNEIDLLAQVRESKAREEERLAATRSRLDEVRARTREHFDLAPDQLRGLAEIAPGAALPASQAIQSRIEKLKAERERLGSVNLRAEEEAQEIEARIEAMTRERADLEAAIGRLRQGIQSLNREGRERLVSAFEAVNKHFGELFRHLFGGGSAELVLVGSEDPLEAGLEIVARPPGKRPQTITLLSGGEQALTTLSLIFAVFLTNPSPICVLDEVDAPLDDANVERFCALLDNMRQRTETRFLVVTHNPITMARMDRLFGVTMAEKGVSQLVSVDLDEAERFREAS